MHSKKLMLRRRTFLGAGLSAAMAATGVSCGGGGRGAGWRFFTAAEAQTVEAICEQIIPADRDAGASQAGVVDYIDIQLTRHFKRYQKTYRQGIAAVDRASRAKFGKRFAELAAGQQSEALIDVEENSRTFFDLILTHTRQGFYGDPRHGGNRNMASWKMLGLPFPPVRGRQRYGEGQPKVG
ncbi:MAG: gluconate 2-dehydrogenase subunit 3 family protein [Bryobacteraceae bacterium]|jgi:gluconate 2-dehydrogenase gamma chain